MTFKTDDRVFETSITTGVGDYTLDGAPTGFIPFSSMGANNSCPYFVTDDPAINWEMGIGTILAGPSRLQRTKILRSSNLDAAVDWGAGTRHIRCGLPAAMAIPRALSKSVAGAANVALTQDEQRRDVLVFTGLLTGNIEVTVDATVWEWTVFNNTTGAFSLTFKVSGAAGVAVPQSKSMKLRCDGVNVVDSVSAVSALSVVGNAAVGGTLGVTGQSNLGNTAVTGNLTASENSGIAATKRFYWDGIGINGDTYTVESAANVLQTVINGNLRQNLTGSTCTYYGMYAQGGGESEGIWSPGTDNSYTLGYGAKRWTVVYATTGTINTSDERDKTNIAPLTDSELAAAMELAKEIGAFQLLDAIRKKGDAARFHVGMAVQMAIEIMRKHGLDPFAYGFICYDEWAETRAEHPEEAQWEETGLLDDKGERIVRKIVIKEAATTVHPAGNRYGFRTDELLLFLARGFDARLTAIEMRGDRGDGVAA